MSTCLKKRRERVANVLIYSGLAASGLAFLVAVYAMLTTFNDWLGWGLPINFW